jgi:hypothetical protein
VINFSLQPLRIALYSGAVFALAGFIFAVLFLLEKLENPNLPVGWASLIIGITLFSGVQLLMLGIIGEFIGRIFMTQNKTPQYTIRKLLNR